MKPAPFQYFAPRTLDEAIDLVAEHGYDAKILAGGQSLIPTMNFRLAQPAVLIDLNHIPELNYIQPNRDGGVRIGAMTRQARVERDDLIAAATPLIHDTIPHIAHPQIRNRGTFGGSIAHADPASELPSVLVTLGGQILARSKRGERWIHADNCFLGIFTTAMEVDEILTEVRFPATPPRAGWSIKETARRHGDYALVGVTAQVNLAADNTCGYARLTFFGVGDGPVPAMQAGAILRGEKPTSDAIAEAARTAAQEDMEPGGDLHASSEFRRHLAEVLGRRALTEAFERATTRGGVA
ncbi:MAG: xanthine dehydrogenase family protein subunit M [Caldilineales bacterium]|nr:xanthine dehydrogenase family protein subunit M [Caldilineales bacterium]